MSERSMPNDAASWICPHGQDARRGCVTCYEEASAPGSEVPSWEVAAWFTAPRPIPIRTLQDVHRHGRSFAIDQPSTPLVYLLTGRTAAPDSVQAVAGVVGFLLHNRHVVTGFTVTETRATLLPRTDTGRTRTTDTWLDTP
ncbi:hypothetical protein [Planomonospora algeriensis]